MPDHADPGAGRTPAAPGLEPNEVPHRRAGVLLHPPSLPPGELSGTAGAFIDFLAAGVQTWWQMLPLNPPGYGGSPYAARSVLAGDPALVPTGPLVAAGLLSHEEAAGPPGAALRTAFARSGVVQQQVDAFGAEAPWVEEWALFEAIRLDQGEAPWWRWPAPLRHHDRAALDDARERLRGGVAFAVFAQWAFFHGWGAIRERARGSGIELMGDMPIFPDHNSSDVWANQGLFKLDREGQPLVVAGVPPDYFSATGQLWGNPLYDWDAMRTDGYRWWVERIRTGLRLFDSIRIDHFRGFAAAWEVPAGSPDATRGEWRPGPGLALFDALREALGGVPFVAEDLGLITPDVRQLRRDSGVPGMAVLQFAFGGDATNPYLPHNLEADCVLYTGTHDNDTTAGWLAAAGEGERDYLRRYLGRDRVTVEDLAHLAYSSVARTVFLPMQDVLGLGSEARMNVPGTAQGNWSWRMVPDALDHGRAAWLRSLARTFGRD
jgi:4-alpha-glucanotransferase